MAAMPGCLCPLGAFFYVYKFSERVRLGVAVLFRLRSCRKLQQSSGSDAIT